MNINTVRTALEMFNESERVLLQTVIRETMKTGYTTNKADARYDEFSFLTQEAFVIATATICDAIRNNTIGYEQALDEMEHALYNVDSYDVMVTTIDLELDMDGFCDLPEVPYIRLV